ncbi:DUF885 domain-containing protein [Nocardia sp. CS682]|uniref:DUF885 domain-containing protein n=1 Tax=Nocardia sp. CS682 TaxID=1047172 RepID=UPI001074CE48|nr:DUF885 domain-containing protein [Nocardia sp. CS682]QBS39507.1 DUF885 domain-containing protein [Nocardia sp. CS682]
MSAPDNDQPSYEPVVREYLLLGLRLGKLIDGFVDCWFGDPRLSARVTEEPPANPTELARQAARLRAELPDSGLPDARQRYLSAQLTALECVAKRLSGKDTPFLDEIRQYFDVDITIGDPECYANAHKAIAELLPGSGGLQERLDAYYERNRIPPDRLQRAVQAVSDELRVLAQPLFGLPAGERVDYEVVHGKPWNAFNRYLGGFRSEVALNDEAGRAIAALPILVTHESYPGHHTDHCLKEASLVREHGHAEQLISLVNTPQCLISEGTAELAHVAVLGSGWGEWTARILAAEGISSDGALVERVRTLVQRLLPARQDAAIMLHDRGADVDDVTDYLQRWLLLPRDRAQHMVSFLTDPLWRAYTVTYIEGARLVGAWLDAKPANQPVAERYLSLLRKPLLPSDLQRELNATTAAPAIGR